MDSQKIKFMISIQKEIDRLRVELGANNPDVMDLKKQFEELVNETMESRSEINIYEIAAVKQDTNAIRASLNIRGDISINYDFVHIERIKNQLLMDNLRMENCRLDMSKDDTSRFWEFGINAFYQLEELLNYFFTSRFSDLESVYEFIIQNHPGVYKESKDDSEIKKENKRKRLEELMRNQVHNIVMADKIFAFTNRFFTKNSDFSVVPVINNLKKLRNLNSHRSGNTDQDVPTFKKFLERQNFDEIREVLIKTTEIIKRHKIIASSI